MKTVVALAALILLMPASTAARPSCSLVELRLDRDENISSIAFARDIHKHWVEKIDAGNLTPAEREIGGDRAWHVWWIGQYNNTISLLKRSRPRCEA